MKPTLVTFLYFLFVHTCLAQEPRLGIPIGHPQGVIDIQCTPDGKYILSKSFNDVNTKVWETRTGKLIFDLKMENGHAEMKIHPSGKSVFIIGGRDSSIIWNLSSGKAEIIIKEIFNHAFYSKNGKQILTFKNKNVQVWDAATGKVLHTYISEDSIISAGYLNNDSNIFVAKRLNDKTHFYLLSAELASSREITYPGVLYNFYFLDFKDSLYLVRFDLKDVYIHRFAYDSLKINRTIRIDSLAGTPTAFSYSKHQGNLLLGMADSTVQLLNLQEGLVYSFNKFEYGFDNVEFVDSGRHFIVKDAVEGAYFDTKEGNTIQNFVYFFESRNLKNVGGVIAVNDQQKRFYLVMSDNTIREYKILADTGFLSQKFIGQTQSTTAPVVSNDHLLFGDDEGYGKMINLKKGEVAACYDSHRELLSDVSYSSSKQLLVTSSWDSTINIWSTSSGRLIKKIKKKWPVISTQINNTNDKMIILMRDEVFESVENWNVSFEVLDLKTYKTIKKISSKQRLVTANFSRDGSLILYCNQTDSTVNVCDVNLNVVRKLKVSGWIYNAYQTEDGRFIMAITGTTVELFDFKTYQLLQSFAIENETGVNCATISKDGNLLAAGTGRGSLNVWDPRSGELLYNRKLHSSSLVPIFINNRELLTSSEDGTIKYWKIDRKEMHPVYQTVPFKANEYITIIPAGFYKGSQAAAKQLHYVTKDLKIISFEQLDVKYNRPDKVLVAIGNTDTALINSYKRAYYKRIKKLGIDTTQFNDGYSVPEADFENRDIVEYGQTNEKLTVRIKANDSAYTLDRFNIWINEVPLFGMKGISIQHRNSNQYDTSISINLSQGENRIETSVTNVNGTESYRMPLYLKYTSTQPIKETVHFIGIGINRFADSRRNLQWCVKDIRDLALKLKEKYKGRIIIDTLFDQNVTLGNVQALKQKLLKTNINDKVIIAYSGHGLLSKQYDYFLSSYNVNFSKPEINGIAYDEIENLLDSIPARKKLLLLDACHSGEVDKDEMMAIQNNKNKAGNKGLIMNRGSDDAGETESKTVGLQNSFELMQSLFVNVGKGTGTTIISAAGGVQFAQERDDLENGVFTFSLLEALNQNKSIKVSALKKYVGQRVEQLTNGLQKPTTRNELKDFDWEVW